MRASAICLFAAALCLPVSVAAQFQKDIQVVPNVPVVAISTWFINNCASLGTGSDTLLQSPRHGVVTFTTSVAPLPPGTCNSISLPANIVYYTWTDADTSAPSDSFQVNYQATSGQTQVQNISVTLNPSPTGVQTAHPIVFLPGIEGSYLDLINSSDSSQNQELWPGIFANHLLLSLYPQDNPSPSIEATDVIKEIDVFGIDIANAYRPVYDLFTSAGYRIYQPPADPAATPCDTTQNTGNPATNPNVFPFPYDWRKDNAGSAQQLANYIGCVQQFYPGATVDLVAHSMGGLIARRYILDYGRASVNSLITIATPWLGAPKLAYVLATGDTGFSPLVLDSTAKYIIGSFAGAHELMPSQAYFDIGSLPPAIESGWDLNHNGIASETYTGPEFESAIDLNYAQSACPGPFCPGETGFDFHAYQNNGNAQDDWRTDTTGVPYFHIAGYQTGDHTVGQMAATSWTTCHPPASNLQCLTKYYFDVTFTSGDGTVPVISSTREGSQNLNAPGYTAAYIPLGDSYEHTSMLGYAPVQSTLLDFLNRADQNGAAIAGSITTAENNPASFIPESQPATYMKINGADSVAVTLQGSSGSPLPGSTPAPTSAAGAQVLQLGSRLNAIAFPGSGTYTVQFATTSEPLAAEWRVGTSITTTSVSRFVDLNVPPGVNGRITVNGAAPVTLQLDEAGDGTYSTTINPTLSLNGSQAADITPPAITLTPSPSGDLLTITAQDSESGLQDLYYSTDGVSYTAYNSPVSISAATTPTVYAFADDKAGNRASAIYQALPQTPSINPSGVVNAASYMMGGVTPGSLASIFGSGFAGSIAAVSVQMDDFPALATANAAGQINVQVPWELAGLTSATVTVSLNGFQSAPTLIPLAPVSPGVFTMDASGSGQGAVLNAVTAEIAAPAGSVAGVPSAPVARGSYISIYCTGLGMVDNQPVSGALSPASPLAETPAPATVSIGGVDAPVTFTGLAPGFVGLFQVNALVPANAPTGDAVTVQLSMQGVAANPVTIAIQ